MSDFKVMAHSINVIEPIEWREKIHVPLTHFSTVSI